MTVALPPHTALFLDLDGTLLDIAPRPDAVVVPRDLPGHLARLRDTLGGALAIVTGRPLEQIDALLPGIPTAIAGEHGGAIRHLPDGPIERPDLPQTPAGWVAAANALAGDHPGALFEPKTHGFVLHYRQAPDRRDALEAALAALLGDDPGYALMPAHMAWEVKPRGADKGRAVARLLQRPPFSGRIPVYVGDDVTDEDGMRVARDAGGLGLRVQDVFIDAAGVRDWLRRLAEAS